MNMIQRVKEWRDSMGFSTQTNDTHHQLFTSETVELLMQSSLEDVADALGDMAVVMCGHYVAGEPHYSVPSALVGLNIIAGKLGVKLDTAFDIVMTSNETKWCTIDDVEATVKKYRDLGVELKWVANNGKLTCYSAGSYPDIPEGKLLKPVTYREPDWSGEEWKNF